MTINDFVARLRKNIDPDISIRVNPNHPDIAGVYWKNIHMEIGCPPHEIFEERNPAFTDAFGTPHRTVEEVEAMARSWLFQMKNDPEFFELYEDEADHLA